MLVLTLTLKACNNTAYGFNHIYYTHFSRILLRGHLYLILSPCLFTT
jgi:hypothetical protein